MNLQVSTVLFFGSSYTQVLFKEPTNVSNYNSDFCIVDGEEVLILRPEHLDDFFACNAVLPQEASFKQSTSQEGNVADNERKKISSQVSPNEAYSEQDASGQEVTRQQGTVVGDELLPSQETVISSSTRRLQNKAHSKQGAPKQDTTRQQGTVAEDELLSSQETVVSSSTGRLPNEAHSKQGAPKQDTTRQQGTVAEDELLSSQETVISSFTGRSPNEAHSKQGAPKLDTTRQQGTVAEDELLSSQETLISSFTSRSPNEAHSKQGAPKQDTTRQKGTVARDELLSSQETVISSSTGEYRKHVFKGTSGNILNLMHKASEEKHSLQLLHAIECNDLNVTKVLPLILQCTISFGVGHTEAVEMLDKVQHLSKKWVINQTEKMSTKSPKDFSSHKTSFATEITVQPNISTRDLALLSRESKEKALPYAWFFLCHSIRNGFKDIQRKVMSFEEVSGIAIKCRISMEELPKVLSYLHKVGLLLYYESILPSVVFEDASLIFKILSSAINNGVFNGHDSIIHISSFSQVNDVYVDHLFTFKDAIELFENLSIIFPIGDTQTFFYAYTSQKSL